MPDLPLAQLSFRGAGTARLLDTNHVMNTAQGVAALPDQHDVDAMTGWVAAPKVLPVRFYAADEFTIGGEAYGRTDFTIGVSWRFGGRVNGTGRCIRDAEAYVAVTTIPFGHSWSIDAHWSEPVQLDRGVAQLSCDFVMRHERLNIEWFTWSYRIFIQGDGAAWSQNLA